MLPNPRISSDLRMLDLLLRSFIRTGIAFFLTSFHTKDVIFSDNKKEKIVIILINYF
jgi:hypothetical protein